MVADRWRGRQRRGAEFRTTPPAVRAGARVTFAFVLERGAPFMTAGFSRMVERAGVQAKLGLRRTQICFVTLRLRADQQAARHPRAAGLPRPQQHPVHGALNRAIADAFQGL
jgi:hypothetical protein